MAHTPERLRRSQEIRYCPIAITDKYPAQITPNNNPLKQVRRVFHFKLSLDASLTSYAPATKQLIVLYPKEIAGAKFAFAWLGKFNEAVPLTVIWRTFRIPVYK